MEDLLPKNAAQSVIVVADKGEIEEFHDNFLIKKQGAEAPHNNERIIAYADKPARSNIKKN